MGEEAQDLGGPIREMLSLYYINTACISHGTLTAFADQLASREFVLLGRLMAIGAIYGHPGPKCFLPAIAESLIYNLVPVIAESDVTDEALKAWIVEVTIHSYCLERIILISLLLYVQSFEKHQ